MSGPPSVIDDNKGEIAVLLDGKKLRRWGYASNEEHRDKLTVARGYVAGWCDGVKYCDGIDAAELFPKGGKR